jgi:ribosome-associated heat shock protein Hsp15
MTESAKLRLDKWLWAARFFKTRSLATIAIDGGKVHYDGQRAKPAKEIHVGATLRITRGTEVFEVIVRALSEHRKGAAEAALLFEETQESQQRRAETAAVHRVEFGVRERGEGRPTKRQRRQIRSFFGD